MEATDAKPDIILPAHRVRVFDPVAVYDERIGGRAVVYLDTNIWIEMRDAATDEAARCRESCLRATNEGRVVFPLSYASVSEVLENPSTDARTRHADLMDALSSGVTLRIAKLVYALEGEAAYRFLFHGEQVPLRRREVFTSLPDHIGDGTMDFPEGWRREDQERFLSHYKKECCSLRSLVDRTDPAQIQKNHKSVETYGERVDAQRAAHVAHVGGRRIERDEFVREERAYLFKEHVLPAMQRASLSELGPERTLALVRRFREEHGDGGLRRLRDVFRTAAPALELFAQILARRSLDSKRKTKPQDFWDIEHASLAPVYADAFVTADGGLIELLRLGDRRPPAARAVLLTSVHELATWVDGLAA